jgi:hypothetical protein
MTALGREADHSGTVRGAHPKKEGSMTSQDDEEKENMRIMWIGSGLIVLFILGMMGLSMLSDTGKGPTEMSGQSRTAPEK